MKLRGPDAEGLFAAPGVGLGHRRLSIIDLSAGTQPFIDRQSGTVIVFNGEIYNFKTVRSQLEARGHTFTSQSDTEVLLHSYLEWGPACLAQLSGMFAFGIYDPRHRQLFIARDRVGIKPLFYCQTESALLFASTIPALRCFPEVGDTMDLQTVSHYLTTIRTTFGRRTMLADVKTLLPGEYMLLTRGERTPRIERYWDYPILTPGEKHDPGMAAAAQTTRELMSNSVREQLISDVPLGGFLSGGLDSSILAYLAHTLSGGRFDAYGVGYDAQGYNEWPYIREAAEFYRMDCKEIHLSENEYPASWKFLIHQKGMPLSTPNEVPIYHLSRALRRDFTVALSGEGADEIFGGYTKAYFAAFDYDRARHEAPGPAEELTALDRAIRRMYRRPYLMCVPDHFFLLCACIPFREKHRLLTGSAWAELEQDKALFQFYEDWFDRLSGCSTFDAYMHIHARINLEGLLSRVDSSTMAASVEARVPFTDHRVAEHLFSLPDAYKINWIQHTMPPEAAELNSDEIERNGMIVSKRLLRETFAANVPASILTRPKMSFPVPVFEWFSGSLKPVAADHINNSPFRDSLFNAHVMDYLLQTADYPASRTALWPVVNLCLWQTQCHVKLP